MSTPADYIEHQVIVLEAAAQVRAMLMHAAAVCGPNRDAVYAALLGAAIACTLCSEEVVELLKVGEDMLAQARVQVTARRQRAARVGTEPLE